MLQGSPFIPFVWILLRTLLHNGTLQVFLFQSIAHSFRRHGGVYPLEGGVKLRVGRCTLAHWHKPLFSSGRAAMTWLAIHPGSREEFRGFRQRLLSLIWGFFREDRNRIAGLEFSAVAPRRAARQAGHL